MKSEIIFNQLFEKESSTYTYLIGDPVSKEAIIIDPVIEMVERDLKLLGELGLNLKYILDTHVHADHITGSGELKKRTGAKIAISAAYEMSCPDILLKDHQVLTFGPYQITAISTPGHTKGCMVFHLNNMIFTGDTLLVRGCGRTDFQDGSSEKLFMSVRERLFSLPDETLVYPAHDYRGFTSTTINMEKKSNPRLNLSLSMENFVKIMSELHLADPAKIHEAVPANLQCGIKK